jgi:hypothetical protein
MIYQKKIFSKKECDLIIDYANRYKDISINPKTFELHEKNRIVSPSNFFMQYYVFGIPMNDSTFWVYSRLFKWFELVTSEKMSDNFGSFISTLHCYKENDGFGRHIDLTEGFEDRRYNIGIQLNENYSGGDYICWDEDKNEILISKKVGTSLCYHAKIEHEIKMVTGGERWSLVVPITKRMIVNQNKPKIL